MAKISLLIPTRHRPDHLNRLLDSIDETIADSHNIEIILYIDEDDKSYQYIYDHTLTVRKIIGSKTETMGARNMTCFRQSTGDIIILLNDDIVIRTKNWDAKLIEAIHQFQDQIYLAYPNDLFKRKKLPTFPILSRKACEILIDPFPKIYQGSFIDTHLFDIFLRLKHRGFHRIIYLRHIVFEHMHHRLNKGKFDEIYASRDRFADDFTFVALAKQRQQQAELLIHYIENNQLDISQHIKELKSANPPEKFLTGMKLCYKTFLQDKNLPANQRLYLSYYHFMRYLAFKLFRKQIQNVTREK